LTREFQCLSYQASGILVHIHPPPGEVVRHLQSEFRGESSKDHGELFGFQFRDIGEDAMGPALFYQGQEAFGALHVRRGWKEYEQGHTRRTGPDFSKSCCYVSLSEVP
jgi:hypothetical protein